MDFKDIVSNIYSPVVATAALTLTVLRDRRDDRKLSIGYGLRYNQMRVQADGRPLGYGISAGSLYWPQSTEETLDHSAMFKMRLLCTNTGRRPLSLVRWAFVVRNKKGHNAQAGGGVIEPAPTIKESESYVLDIIDVENRLPSSTDTAIGLIVQDSHGKGWTLSSDAACGLSEAVNDWLKHKDDKPRHLRPVPRHDSA